MAGAVPGLRPRKALAQNLSGTLNFTTWPNYFAQANFDEFTKKTGVPINVAVFGSNEEMLAKLQAGGTGWDVFVPTNYTISTYKDLGLIEPLDLKRLPSYDPATQDARFTSEGTIDGTVYAVPKDWGTTGYVINTKNVKSNPTSWKEFWDLTKGELTGRTMVHDYQLTTIGNALKYFGYSFNSQRREAAGRRREAAARGQAASLRDQFRLSAVDAQRRCLDVGVLDGRCGAAPSRHSGNAVCARQGRRRDLDRLLCDPEGRAESATRPMPSSTTS